MCKIIFVINFEFKNKHDAISKIEEGIYSAIGKGSGK